MKPGSLNPEYDSPMARIFGYSAASAPDATVVSASFDGTYIRVLLPRKMVNAWAEGSSVAIEGPPNELRILVEKDFQCLHGNAVPDPDAYPNPLA